MGNCFKKIVIMLFCFFQLAIAGCGAYRDGEVKTASDFLRSGDFQGARNVIKNIKDDPIYFGYHAQTPFVAPKKKYLEYIDTVEEYVEKCKNLPESNLLEVSDKSNCYGNLQKSYLDSHHEERNIRCESNCDQPQGQYKDYPFGILPNDIINRFAYHEINSSLSVKRRELEPVAKNSRECKIAETACSICGSDLDIKDANKIINGENRVGNVSGYVNATAIHQAAQVMLLQKKQFVALRNKYRELTKTEFNMAECKGYAGRRVYHIYLFDPDPDQPLVNHRKKVCGW